jgi:hypothetical protein
VWLVASGTVSVDDFPPILQIGLLLLVWQCKIVNDVLLDALRRRTAVYALTDRRALVIGGLFARRAQSFPLESFTSLTLREGKQGSGTIFCSGTVGDCHKKNRRGELVPRPLFRRIVDARHVYDLMRDAQARPPTGTW